jgi:hypothetical protein
MKYILLLTILVFSCPVFCQDILFLRTGEEIEVKLLKIKPNLVKYKLYNNLQGPELTIKKNKLFKVQYANGLVYTFEHFVANSYSKSIIRTDSLVVPDNLYFQGQQDARLYYHSYEGAQIGTIAATAVSGPLFGLIPAVVSSSVTPTYQNLGFPDYRLIQQPEAKRIKSKNVWKGYGISSLAYLTVSTVATAALLILSAR